MGLAENAFQKILSKFFKNQQLDKSDVLTSSTRRLELFSALCLKPSFTPNILSSRKFVGLSRTSLYLPQISHLVSSEEDALKIYIHLILQISAANNLGISQPSRLTDIASRIETIKQLPLINQYLDKHFTAYRMLQSEILEIAKCYAPQKNRHTPLFSFWLSHFLSRNQSGGREAPADQYKINEPIPNFLLLSTSCVKIADQELDLNTTTNQTPPHSKTSKELTELNRRHSAPTEKVDLEKNQNNPIYHSFEKTETADEYQGGRRIDSGTDELAEHSAALEELDLSQVTTGGESAQSIYRTEGETNGTSFSTESITDSESNFVYPEWNSRNRKYLKDHCRLYELPALEKNVKQTFRANIEQNFSAELKRGREKIANMVNEPAWQNRLKEGDEIDFDAFTRDYISLCQRRQLMGRWYAQKRKLIRDATIYILFDQSLSSDSWVENRRILDLFIEALSITGILFEDLLPQTHVAGAWSATRHQCAVQTYKAFNDPWSDFFSRIHHIEPQGYTRLGPAIRHATQILATEPSRNRLLLLLTDGKPTDLDGYEGSHGINDIRQACLEAEGSGIVPYALTVDHSGNAMFAKMFRRYKILAHPKHLPIELLGILGQLLGKSK